MTKILKIKSDQYCIFFEDKFQKDLIIDKQPIKQLAIEEINDKIQPTFNMVTKEELLDLIILHNDLTYVQYLSNIFLFNLKSIYNDTDDLLNDVEQILIRMKSDIKDNQFKLVKPIIEQNQIKIINFLNKLYIHQYSNILSTFTVQKLEKQIQIHILEENKQKFDIFMKDINQQMKLNQVQVQYPTFYQITNQPIQKRKISNVTTERIKVEQEDLERNLTLIIENDQKLFTRIVQNLFQKLFNSLGYFDIVQLITCKNTMSVQQSINSHNGLAILIQKIVLSNKNQQQKQVKILLNIIKTIYDLLLLNNYEGVFCLYSAITTSSVLRCYRQLEKQLVDVMENETIYTFTSRQSYDDLIQVNNQKSNHTTGQLSTKQNTQIQQLSISQCNDLSSQYPDTIQNLTISTVLAPSQNYATYRQCIQKCIQNKYQSIPYIGILKRDLALLAESSTFQAKKQYINFNKLENVYTYCIQALELQTLNQQFDDNTDFLCDQIIFYSQTFCKDFDIWDWSDSFKE